MQNYLGRPPKGFLLESHNLHKIRLDCLIFLLNYTKDLPAHHQAIILCTVVAQEFVVPNSEKQCLLLLLHGGKTKLSECAVLSKVTD